MLKVLSPLDDSQPFPDPEKALKEPNGLLAVGGRLSPTRLETAYRHGIFPWYSPGEPILWWSPDPRLVLFPEHIKISRSLRKCLRRHEFEISCDRAFVEVIDGCAAPRPDCEGTWITAAMRAAYLELYQLGFAHSVEAWQDGELAGGLYGVGIGQVFFGESMFCRRSNASKAAFATLAANLRDWGYQIIDCQVRTEHLVSLGAEEIKRNRFLELLRRYCDDPVSNDAWRHLTTVE